MSAPAPPRHLPSELALGAALALMLGFMAFNSQPNPDAYTYASHGLRLLMGEVPHRDYFEFTPPGAQLLAAAVMAVTGPSMLALRLVQGATLVLAGWLAARLTRRLGAGPWAATLPGLALVLALYRFLPHWSYHWLVLAPLLGVLLAACRGLAGGGRRDWLTAGVLTGLATLALHSDGVALALAIGGALVADVLVGATPPAAAARRAGWVALGAVLPLAPVVAWYAAAGALAAAYEQIWVFTLTQYARAGGVNDIRFATDLGQHLSPMGNWTNLPAFWARVAHALALYTLVVGVGAGAVAWAAGVLARRIRAGVRWDADEAAWGVCGLAALGFGLLAMRGRADITHVALYALPSLIVATAAAAALARRLDEPGLALARWLPLGAIAGFVAAGAVAWGEMVMKAPGDWLTMRSPDAIARETPLISWLRERARPGDRVAAFPNGGYVYVYGLPPAVATTLLLPGYLPEAEVLAYWRQVRARQPRFLVFVPASDPAVNRAAFMPEGIPPGWRLAKTFDAPLGERMPWPTEVYERVDAAR